jgi:hypothetical protein
MDLFLYVCSPGIFIEFLIMVFSEFEQLFPSETIGFDTSQIVFPTKERSWRLIGTWSNKLVGEVTNVIDIDVEDNIRCWIPSRPRYTISRFDGRRQNIYIGS